MAALSRSVKSLLDASCGALLIRRSVADAGRMRTRSRLFSLLVPFVLVGAASRVASADTWDPTVTAAFDISDYVTGLGQVTDFRFLPDGRMIIVEKDGASHTRLADGTLVDAGSFPVNTVSEQGLLGVEVDPAFATNHKLFFYYSAAASAGGTNDDRHRVVSMTLKADNTLDFTSEQILVRGLHGPANHDGGGLALGPDGMLYIGVGDTGCNSNTAPDPPYTPTNFFGTCLSNGNGKILRVALDGSIPSDNPLAGLTAVSACGTGGACGAEATNPASIPNAAPRTEIYAWGFRNPWRFWFEPTTNKLWVADVGEISYEEIDIVEKGKHMGWPWREATHGWPNSKCQEIVPNVGDCVDPVYECSHSATTATEDGDCQSINGGLIVDSCTWSAPFKGLYYFGDNSRGTLWTVQPTAARDGIVKGSRKQIGKLAGAVPVSIRGGPDGNLYIAALPGRIIRLAPKTPATCPPGTDAGTDAGPPSDGGTNDSGSSGGDSSTNPDGGSGGDTGSSSGCGCTVVGAQDVRVGALAFAGLAAIVVTRRRRRR